MRQQIKFPSAWLSNFNIQDLNCKIIFEVTGIKNVPNYIISLYKGTVVYYRVSNQYVSKNVSICRAAGGIHGCVCRYLVSITPNTINAVGYLKM